MSTPRWQHHRGCDRSELRPSQECQHAHHRLWWCLSIAMSRNKDEADYLSQHQGIAVYKGIVCQCSYRIGFGTYC